MKILAIETSGMTGSVAALEADQVLVELSLDPQLRSARSLAPAIEEVLKRVGWRAAEIALVAVTNGPGSFTGLRIGVTTAKALAYGIGCPTIGVSTLATIAAQVPAAVAHFAAVLDAQRGELFVGEYRRTTDGELAGHELPAPITSEAWLSELREGTAVTGPGLKKLVDRLPEGVTAVDSALWEPSAATVGRLGWRAFGAGIRDDAFSLLPRYLRRTAAEEHWDGKHVP